MDPKYFSVIIPTLNEEKFIPKLLHDLKIQKDINFETIVVDGNSQDQTKKIVNSFQQKIKNLYFYSVEKRNVSFQRNFGALKARGKYLVFLDADSRISNSFISNLKKEILKSHHLIYLPAIKPQSLSYQDIFLFNATNLIIELSQLTHKPFSSGGSIIIQKDFFHFLGGFDEKLFLAEDHEIVQRAKKMGVSAKFLRNIKVRFSLRRMKREGRLEIFFKYLMASIHYLTRGRIERKLFEYKMGGLGYNENKKKNFSLEKTLKHNLTVLKKQIRALIS